MGLGKVRAILTRIQPKFYTNIDQIIDINSAGDKYGRDLFIYRIQRGENKSRSFYRNEAC